MRDRIAIDENHVARFSAEVHAVPRYHADVEVWVPVDDPDSSAAAVTYFKCDHDHKTPEAAEICGRALAHKELKRATR